jgi:hypothetical protein
MGQTVFYRGLDDLCRTYMVANRHVTLAEFCQFPDRLKEQHGSIFEQLMLFDKVSFKVYGENIQIPFLLNLLGRDTFDELIDQGAIGFTLWTPVITHLVTDIAGVVPIQSGTLSSPAHSDPEQSLTLGLNWMRDKLTAHEQKRMVKRVLPLYEVPEKDISQNAVSITVSAYNSGKLKALNYHTSGTDIERLALPERQVLCQCATELLEYSYLIKRGMTSFSNKHYFSLFDESASKVQLQAAIAANFNRLAILEGFPDLKALHAELEDPFKNLAQLRAKRSSVKFREWLAATSFSATQTDITKEYVDSIADATGFFETRKGKVTKSVVMTAIGAAIGAAIGGVEGALGGAAVAKAVETGADLTLDLVDEFLISGLTKGWSPRMFFDDVAKFRVGKDKRA